VGNRNEIKGRKGKERMGNGRQGKAREGKNKSKTSGRSDVK
jgi:hypothetical protein